MNRKKTTPHSRISILDTFFQQDTLLVHEIKQVASTDQAISCSINFLLIYVERKDGYRTDQCNQALCNSNSFYDQLHDND